MCLVHSASDALLSVLVGAAASEEVLAGCVGEDLEIACCSAASFPGRPPLISVGVERTSFSPPH